MLKEEYIPTLDDLLEEHTSKLRNIYNIILEEAKFISSNLLTNDHLGFQNVFNKIHDLVRDSLEIRKIEIEEDTESELEDDFFIEDII